MSASSTPPTPSPLPSLAPVRPRQPPKISSCDSPIRLAVWPERAVGQRPCVFGGYLEKFYAFLLKKNVY